MEGRNVATDEAGPNKKSLDSFAAELDIPEDLSSPMQGNPAMPSEPGAGLAFGDSFKEKLRRRRAKDVTPARGELSYG